MHTLVALRGRERVFEKDREDGEFLPKQDKNDH